MELIHLRSNGLLDDPNGGRAMVDALRMLAMKGSVAVMYTVNIIGDDAYPAESPMTVLHIPNTASTRVRFTRDGQPHRRDSSAELTVFSRSTTLSMQESKQVNSVIASAAASLLLTVVLDARVLTAKRYMLSANAADNNRIARSAIG